MLTIIVLSVFVPVIGWAVFEVVRTKRPTMRRNCDGVALQTVIVIVVLLAIAGAVAGVLLTRGGEAVAEAEQQDILREGSEFTHQGLCESYGFVWATNVGSCYRTLPNAPLANTFNTKTACEGAIHLGTALNYMWTPVNPGGADEETNGSCA